MLLPTVAGQLDKLVFNYLLLYFFNTNIDYSIFIKKAISIPTKKIALRRDTPQGREGRTPAAQCRQARSERKNRAFSAK